MKTLLQQPDHRNSGKQEDKMPLSGDLRVKGYWGESEREVLRQMDADLATRLAPVECYRVWFPGQQMMSYFFGMAQLPPEQMQPAAKEEPLFTRPQAERLFDLGVEMDALHPLHGWVDAGVKTAKPVGLPLWGGPGTMYRLKISGEDESR
jgi:hypothetical protein